MSSVRVAYNEKGAPLEVLLRTIDRPGDFCTQDRMLVPMPRVEVEGARSLSFPITLRSRRMRSSRWRNRRPMAGANRPS